MNTTTKRFARSTAEAFQQDNACAITAYRSPRAWGERALVAAVIVFVLIWIAGVM